MSDRPDEPRLAEGGLDVDAWRADEPPRDFTERVMREIMAERAGDAEPDDASRESPGALAEASARGPVGGARKGRRRIALGVAASFAAAAAFALVASRPPTSGEAIARERMEVHLGSRGIAVLEPGAKVTWKGDDVVQASGAVFYRVEPGGRFRVHTPAGDAEVLGTCFTVKVRGASNEGSEMQKRDVKSGAIGAALSAMAFVAVYEGKVAVSHAGQRAELTAGESATTTSAGVRRASADQASAAASAFAAADEAPKDPVTAANENLVGQVQQYKSALEKIQSQKTQLEKKLSESEARLAAGQDGAAGKAKSEYDLSPDDWAELAKKGTVKYRVPCTNRDAWSLSQSKLDKLGLAPTDAPVLRDAYERSYKRLWAEIRPLCAQALGSANAVDKIGLNSCTHLIYDVASANDRNAAEDERLSVAEIRAGLRPPPGPSDKVSPVQKMFLTLTDANAAFESDIARTFGPEEAHRLAYSEEMCSSNSSWGGRKRGPKP